MFSVTKAIIGGGDFFLAITASVANPNIRALATARGWDGRRRLIVNITAPLINTLDTGNTPYPGGLRINISASTRIGGTSNGGTAFYARVACEVSAAAGSIISGGGGSGGNGGDASAYYGSTNVFAYGGRGGTGQGFADASSLTITPAGSGNAGQYTSQPVVGGTLYARGGDGGGGGMWGGGGVAYGNAGSYGGPNNGGTAYLGQSPSSPGLAVDGNSKVTWLSLPTFQGPRT